MLGKAADNGDALAGYINIYGLNSPLLAARTSRSGLARE